jgi:hypothetical protein
MRVRVPGRAPSLVFLAVAAALALAAGVSAGSARLQQGCETPVFKNGLDVNFGRYTTKAGADRRTSEVKRLGFSSVQTVQETCNVWESVLRGLESYSTAVGVQSEARRVKYSPTIECMVAQEIGQLQAIFGTRATMDELASVISTAARFGYVGLKTKPAPCGGYQAYVAGFTSKAQATDFARTASERSGLDVVVIKA